MVTLCLKRKKQTSILTTKAEKIKVIDWLG